MTDDDQNVPRVRECFAARLLTDDQFEDAVAITKIIEREINKTGQFREKLGDYAYAYGRKEHFDAVKSEMILRDIFKERVGMSMNAVREQLVKHEDTYTDADQQRTRQIPSEIESLMKQGSKITFNRALAQKSGELGSELGVTDIRAKTLIRDEFEQNQKSKFYDWGHSLDEKYYRTQIQAEKQLRQQKAQSKNFQKPYRPQR